MRLVVDLQACQTESRDRGIGRYAMGLARAIASGLEEHDQLIITTDMAGVDSGRDVRNELRRSQVRAKVVAYGYPVTEYTDSSPTARSLAGQLRARFFASLRPDALLMCSLFETGASYTTEVDWRVLRHLPTAVVAHDLIPLLFPDRYLQPGYFHSGRYYARLEDLKRFDLILSNSEATKRDLVAQLSIDEDRIVVVGAGLDATLDCPSDEAEARRRLQELGIARPFVLMVGNGDWRKNTLGALRAFVDLPEGLRAAHELVLTQVGDDVRHALATDYAHLNAQIHILGRVDDPTLALLYRECRVFFFPSYYEGFGFPVLEAMAFNAPVLSSNAGSLPEVVHDPDVLFDPRSHEEGVGLLAKTLSDARFREKLCRGAREHALTFTWERTACKSLQALRGLSGRKGCQAADGVLRWPSGRDIELMADASIETGATGEQAIADGLRAIARCGKRRVLVDITEITRLDAKTGIQRVTRKFFAELSSIAREDGDFEVEPICWTPEGIVFAREFARSRLGVPCVGPDTPVIVQPSDLAFMLDSSWWSPERFDEFHARVHEAGGEVVWMVYDLIPIRFPETCDVGMDEAFETWLSHAVHSADGFLCISEATRVDLEAYMDGQLDAGCRRPWTCSVRLGSDVVTRTDGAPSQKIEALRAAIGDTPYCVALGTLEPRKDHGTILDAFELLWSRGLDLALVIIGKRGWNVEALAERIEHHPNYGRRLFWLQGVADGDVQQLLKGSAALIQASLWEGFGLPLIEAGSLGVPLIVTDIAVFHEVAGESATYFPVGDAVALADAIAAVALGDRHHAPPLLVRPNTWREATLNLARTLLPGVLPGENAELRLSSDRRGLLQQAGDRK